MGPELLKLTTGGFLMGWGPCLAYTAPLLLPYIGGTGRDWAGALRIGALFVAGRVLALAILGVLATVAFQTINRFFPPHRSGYLYLLAAAIIIVLGALLLAGRPPKMPWAERQEGARVGRGALTVAFLGFLYGITPCAPLVAVLTYVACVAQNAAVGLLYAVAFGVSAGIPLLILAAATGLIPQKLLTTPRARRMLQVVCGVILILFGAQLIYSVLFMLL